MKRKNSTRNALISSIVSLLLCVSMLVSTTFAWFTDSVTSANNIIKSGTLDVEMYWADGKTDPESATWTDASKGAIFDYDLWEPGYTQVCHIKIVNVGNLALKYKLSILANGVIDDSNGVKLSDVIDVYYVDPAVQVANRSALTDAYKLDTLTNVLGKLGETGNGELLPGASDTITIALKMKESAGNEYMNKSIGTDFIVQLVATQLTHEIDSFDDQYDADAATPVYTAPVPLPESGPMTIGDNTISATLPEALVDLLRGNMGSNPDNTPPSLRLVYDENPAVNPLYMTIELDFADVVDQDGNVVDLEAMNNQIPITVKLDVSANFTEGDPVKVYHDGELVATPTVDANGYITYEALHFCEIKIVDPNTYLVDSVDTFRAAMKNPGANIVLINDINIEDDKGTGYALYAKYNMKINLNGHDVKVDMSDKTFYGIIYVLNDAKVDIVGEGNLEINGGVGPFVWCTGANGNAEVNIYGGNWTQNSADFTDKNYCEGIYANRTGAINIYGGVFEWKNFEKMTVNESREGVINIYGGTFINFDPRISHDNDGSYVADGYTVVSETQANGDIWYTVVPVN